MPWSPHLMKTSGGPHCISKSMTNHLSEKKITRVRVLLLLRLNLHVEGILVAIQLKSTVRDLFTESGIDNYFNSVWAFAAAGNFTA